MNRLPPEYKNETERILGEMAECLNYCSLIKKTRFSAGFNSLKYPITDVKINRYFTPEYRKLIAEDCNIVGYMDIPPVEDVFDYGEPKGNYHYEKDGDLEIWLSETRSSWQEDLYQERLKKREEAEDRKSKNI